MKNVIKLVIAVVILAVLVYLLFVFDVPRAKAPERDTSFSTTTPFEFVHVAVPASGAKISSPVSISGEVRGSWFFEASFPIQIIGADGAVLGSSAAHAGGDWMTASFVPFTASVEFAPKGNKTGIIRFMKDNPSGIKSLEAHQDLPVTF